MGTRNTHTRIENLALLLGVLTVLTVGAARWAGA